MSSSCKIEKYFRSFAFFGFKAQICAVRLDDISAKRKSEPYASLGA
jgi:hypothetical protein